MLELEPHITAIVGALTAALGAGVVVWGAMTLGSRSTEGRSESLLAPTLAVDTLDSDLRIVYMRTLVVDARCQARFGRDSAAMWSPLTRELRRAIVFEQARRVAGDPVREPDPHTEILDGAMELLSSREEIRDRWKDLVQEVRALLDQPEHRQPGEKRSKSD